METKTTELRFRVSPKDKEAIKHEARKEKLSVSEYLRLVALDTKLKRART